MSDGKFDAPQTAPQSRMKTIWENLIIGRPGIVVGALLVVAVAWAVGGFSGGNAAGLQANADDFQQARVVRVVDGDTLVLQVDGAEERVRLIGINCPESVAPEEERNSEEGREACRYTKQLVGEGDTVWLESDANDRDQYDRLLRYVWLEKPTDPNDVGEIRQKMLNGILVADGYAEARRYGEDTDHAQALEQLGREAAEEGRGVSDFWN